VLLPIGLDETRLSRLPWVSIGLLVANVAVFALTSTSSAEDELEARFGEVVEHWSRHPGLELPEEMDRRFGLDAEALSRLTGSRDEVGGARATRADQARLDELCEALFEAHDATPTRRFGLVPERGAAQPGWLTHQFMHGGFGHILGNMLIFFLVVGPFLEEAWGRPFFLAFYLTGGLAAGLAQALPALDSGVPIVGASGAISACLGAFALRFAHRRVRIFYWFLVFIRGSFLVPAWLYAFFGLGMDLLGLHLEGTDGGIAYGAHVGGFLFGLGVAVALRASGLEARLTPEGAVAQGRSFAGSRAAEALADGRTGEARAHLEAALRRDPDDPEALAGLARIAAASLDRAGATAHAARLFTRLATRDPAAARALLVELAPVLEAEGFRPAQAYRAAEMVSADAPELADGLDEVAARTGGAVAAKALLRAAQRSRARDPRAALDRAERAAAAEGAPPEIAARAAELAAELRGDAPASPDRFAALELPDEEPPPAAPRLTPAPLELEPPAPRAPAPPRAPLLDPVAPVRLVHCRVVGADAAGLRMVTPSGARTLAPARVAAVAAGLVAEHALAGEVRRNAVLLDLLLHPQPGDAGRVVVRVPGHAIALGVLHPGVPPQDAFGRVVDAILSASGAAAAPSPAAAAGRPFSRFADAAAFERAAWGRALSA
jgi:membrane associated rhomboid family serine protease